MNQPTTGAGNAARIIRRVTLAGLLGASCLTAPSFAMAAAAEAEAAPAGTALEELVVTARRREERLQDVPEAVVVITSRAMDEQGVHNVNDLSRVAPGLSIQNTAANRVDTTYSIRGQGLTFGTSTPAVVAYFADVPDFSTAIYDLENIQVLKGPQGTLFGKNTTGGAILFTPRAPSNEFSGYALGRFGNYERADMEVGFGGPIIADHLMFRVAGQRIERNGYTTNKLDGAKLDNENRDSWRASLTVQPFEGLQNTTLYQHSVVNENGSGAVLTQVAPLGTPFGSAALQAQLALQQSLGIRTVIGNYLPHYALRKTNGWINTSTWKVNEHLTLKNIYSQRHNNGGQSYDLDATNLTLLHVTNPPSPTPSHTKTEEAQAQVSFGPISGVFGYYHDQSASPHAVGFRIEQGPATIQVLGQGASKTTAVFSQMDWKITDQLTVTGGARRTKATVSSGPQETQLILPTGPFTINATPVASSQFNSTTWNVAANYKITPDLNVYATVRKGYKPGGFNGTAQLASDRPYQPESVTDYEAGIKGQQSLGDMQARFAVDVFYDDFKNIQRFVNLPTVPAQTLVRNAAAGKISGLDVDLTVVANDIFQVGLNYTYLHTKYDRYDDPGLGDLSKSRFPNSPKHQLTLTP
ncbi:MAG: TonB-dependent receptor, partial [Phenylobacterium sp.]|nr:TonB-dependent receptor [Phenylobacterium sp.]